MLCKKRGSLCEDFDDTAASINRKVTKKALRVGELPRFEEP